MSFYQYLLCVVVFLESCLAARLYENATLPTDLTTACTAALLAEINCDQSITNLFPEEYYSEDILNVACTDTCNTSLTAYESNIVKACESQNFGGEENWDLTRNPINPVAMIPNELRFNYGLACLKDSGRFCNLVTAAAAASVDQDTESPAVSRRGISPVSDPLHGNEESWNSGRATQATFNPCDLCFIKSLQYEASGPYGNGVYLQAESIYQSLTSSCSVQSLPPSTWTLPYSTTTSPVTPAPTCGGKLYTISEGDTCYSISDTQGIGTGWLLTDNNLAASCDNFPTSGNLCLKNICTVYGVTTNDTCGSIAKSSQISIPQLRSWNLVLNSACDNVAKLLGTYLCVSNPGGTYLTPNVTLVNPTTATTQAPVPANTGAGSNTYCGDWHVAASGEYCNILTYQYHISLTDFIFLNPSINENCTNLYADYAYCVEPVGDINTYSGRAGYNPTTTSMSNTVIWSNLPNATFSTPTSTVTPPPLASGVRGDCSRYFPSSDFPEGVNGTTSSWSACERVGAAYGVSMFDLGNWNIGLNTTSPDCMFQSGVRYCGQWYDGDPLDVDESEPLQVLPIRDGAAANCTEYVSVNTGWTCENVLTLYDLTIGQFYIWNPAVGSQCENLWAGYRYCVLTSDYVPPSETSSGTAPSTTTTNPNPTPSPVQGGQPSNCNAWHKAVSGDGCYSIASDASIALDDFYAWNPAVGDGCSNGVWLDYYYCVATSDSPQPTRTTAPASSTFTKPAAPSPTQDNNIDPNCNKYDIAVSGDTCSGFASRNSITLNMLGTWNALLKPDGNGCAGSFWGGYYYCTGVSS